MANIEFVKIDASAVEVLQEVSIQTFTEAYAAVNTAENMAQYIAHHFSLDKLREELECSNTIFFLAKAGDEVAGYLKLNFGESQTDIKDPASIEIERIYVKQAFQRQRLGQLLINQTLEIARQQNKSYIWLGVWEENLKAIAFYQKMGFVQFGTHKFKFAEELQQDLLMRLEVKAQ